MSTAELPERTWYVTLALRELVEPAAPPFPTTREGRAEYLRRGDSARLARAERRIEPGERLPARGTPARRSYEAALRRWQRYTTTGGERREPRGAARDALDALVRQRIAERMDAQRVANLARLARGFRARVHAWVSPSPPHVNARPQWLPGGGLRKLWPIGPPWAAEVADAYQAGDDAQVEASTLAGIFGTPDAYGDRYWPEQDASVVDHIDATEVEWL